MITLDLEHDEAVALTHAAEMLAELRFEVAHHIVGHPPEDSAITRAVGKLSTALLLDGIGAGL